VNARALRIGVSGPLPPASGGMANQTLRPVPPSRAKIAIDPAVYARLDPDRLPVTES
jgi:hypothetical protein